MEQELIDRKQIGLFGIKKNQEIMGTNRTSNNYHKHQSSGRGANNKNENIWNLKNKHQLYSSVVSPVSTSDGMHVRDEFQSEE